MHWSCVSPSLVRCPLGHLQTFAQAGCVEVCSPKYPSQVTGLRNPRAQIPAAATSDMHGASPWLVYNSPQQHLHCQSKLKSAVKQNSISGAFSSGTFRTLRQGTILLEPHKPSANLSGATQNWPSGHIQNFRSAHTTCCPSPSGKACSIDCIVSSPDAFLDTTIGDSPGSPEVPKPCSGMNPSMLIPDTNRVGPKPPCSTFAAAAASPPWNPEAPRSLGTPAAAVFESCMKVAPHVSDACAHPPHTPKAV